MVGKISSKKPIRLLFCALILPFLSLAQVKLTYTGNMGVLVEGQHKSVLIDGLHEYYGPAYLPPSTTLISDLCTQGGQYEIPDVLLFTHEHKDHFSPKLAAKVNSTIVGPKQVLAKLTNTDVTKMKQVKYQSNLFQSFKFSELEIEAVRMDHTYKQKHASIQNIGYMINIDNLIILHVGDSDWYQPMFEALDLKSKQIDVAIIPIWFVMHERSEHFLEHYLDAKTLIITHIDPRMDQQKLSVWKEKFPNAVFFEELGQQHVVQ